MVRGQGWAGGREELMSEDREEEFAYCCDMRVGEKDPGVSLERRGV